MADLAERVAILNGRIRRLDAPTDRPRPVVFPSYGSPRRLPNLTPLVALLLRRFEAPVLIHGWVDHSRDSDRATTAAILAHLGIDPVHSIKEAQRRMRDEGIAFVPTTVLSDDVDQIPIASSPDLFDPALALIDPFGGRGFRVVPAAESQAIAAFRAYLVASRADALLVCDGEGETSPLEWFERGEAHTLNGNESSAYATRVVLPDTKDAQTTARWIAAALAGETPIPLGTLNQLACCLIGARLRVATDD